MMSQLSQLISALLLLIIYVTTCCSGFSPSSCSSPVRFDTKKCLEIENHVHFHSAARRQQPSFPSFSSTTLSLSDQNDLPTDNDVGSENISPLGVVGIACQPIVWISLGFVATTGAGLPAGPFGLLGAVEGLSYLVVVGLSAYSIIKGKEDETSNASFETAQKLSSFTLLAALLTLLSLVKDQGCIPNAKPILDYSNYLPVCNPEDTPGFFG